MKKKNDSSPSDVHVEATRSASEPKPQPSSPTTPPASTGSEPSSPSPQQSGVRTSITDASSAANPGNPGLSRASGEVPSELRAMLNPQQQLVAIPVEQFQAMEMAIKGLQLQIEQLKGGASQKANGYSPGWQGMIERGLEVGVKALEKVGNIQGDSFASQAMARMWNHYDTLDAIMLKNAGAPPRPDHMRIVE